MTKIESNKNSWLKNNPNYDKKWIAKNRKRKSFTSHKSNAKWRGIEFNFTLETWIEFWGDDYEDRGGKKDQLCCARIGDTGPYEADNCCIVTNRENLAMADRGWKTKYTNEESV